MLVYCLTGSNEKKTIISKTLTFILFLKKKYIEAQSDRFLVAN